MGSRALEVTTQTLSRELRCGRSGTFHAHAFLRRGRIVSQNFTRMLCETPPAFLCVNNERTRGRKYLPFFLFFFKQTNKHAQLVTASISHWMDEVIRHEEQQEVVKSFPDVWSVCVGPCPISTVISHSQTHTHTHEGAESEGWAVTWPCREQVQRPK